MGGSGGDSANSPASVVRCIAFSRCGNFLAAGTDDKTTHLFSTDTWNLIKSIRAPKKISAVGFTADGSVLLAANKFGDVVVTPTAPSTGPNEPQFEPFLGHYCSVITSLALSHDGQLLSTTDRDGKVRVNKMPETPLQGCHEIQCFGFGHTDFVSCSVFVKQGDQEVLVSGGGDGTLRMWDKLDGRELSILQLGNAEDINSPQPILAVCASQDGNHLIAALDGVKELCVVEVDVPGGKLKESGRCGVAGIPYPTDICLDTAGKFLIASGPLNISGTNADTAAGTAAAAAVVCCELDSDNKTLTVATSEALSADAKVQLQKCDESQVEIEKIVPQKVLPGYLHKRAFVPQEEYLASRKAGKKEHGAGPSTGAGEAAEEEEKGEEEDAS